MHDALRQRLMRRIESLPDAQIYQVLDYIEFLETKYAVAEKVEASGLQKFAEGLEDRLRKKAVSPTTIREAFQLISAADRVLSGVSSAGKRIISDLGTAIDGSGEDEGSGESDARLGESSHTGGAGSSIDRPPGGGGEEPGGGETARGAGGPGGS